MMRELRATVSPGRARGLVIVDRDARERGHRLALGTGGYGYELVGRGLHDVRGWMMRPAGR